MYQQKGGKDQKKDQKQSNQGYNVVEESASNRRSDVKPKEEYKKKDTGKSSAPKEETVPIEDEEFKRIVKNTFDQYVSKIDKQNLQPEEDEDEEEEEERKQPPDLTPLTRLKAKNGRSSKEILLELFTYIFNDVSPAIFERGHVQGFIQMTAKQKIFINKDFSLSITEVIQNLYEQSLD